jgi:hypothetical protein
LHTKGKRHEHGDPSRKKGKPNGMNSYKPSQPKQPRRKYGKESEKYLGKDNYTISKEITTESRIAYELVAQFAKTSSNANYPISGR